MLIAGLGMRGGDFGLLTAELAKLGLEALTFDHLNVGSAPRVADLTIDTQATYCWTQVNKAYGEISSILLFGISMGAAIAATMAAQKTKAHPAFGPRRKFGKYTGFTCGFR